MSNLLSRAGIKDTGLGLTGHPSTMIDDLIDLTTMQRGSLTLCSGSVQVFIPGSRPAMKWEHYPNLAKRPHAPAAGRGRLQTQVRRALIVHGPLVTTSQ